MFVEPPEGFDPPSPNCVCLLRKGVYGQPDAGRLCEDTCDKLFAEIGLTPTLADPQIFWMRRELKFEDASGGSQEVTEMLVVGKYVDDIIPASNSASVCPPDVLSLRDMFVSRLSERLKFSAKGRLSWYCSVAIDDALEDARMFRALLVFSRGADVKKCMADDGDVCEAALAYLQIPDRPGLRSPSVLRVCGWFLMIWTAYAQLYNFGFGDPWGFFEPQHVV